MSGPSSMSSSAAAAAAAASLALDPSLKSAFDILGLFESSGSVKAGPLTASSSSSSPSVSGQQITLSSVLYDVDLATNVNGETEISLEAANLASQKLPPDCWRFSGVSKLGTPDSAQSCCFSADSKYFITSGYGESGSEHNISMWNPSTRTLAVTLTGHTNYIYALASFNLNGKIMLASGSNDQTIRVWKLKDPAFCVITLEATSETNSLAFCCKQNLLISGHNSGIIKFWSASNWQCVQTLSTGSSSPVRALAVSSDDSKFASLQYNGFVCIWDTTSRREIKRWQALNQYYGLNGLHFSPSQSDVLVVACGSGGCTSWNCAAGTQIGKSWSSAQTSSPSPVSFFPNGKFLATASETAQVSLVDSSTSTVIKTLGNGCPSIQSLSSTCYSPNGKYLAALCTTYPDTASFCMWESPLPVVSTYSIVAASASDFRLALLNESTCLVVAHLDSGDWAVALAEATPTKIVLNEWAIVPSSMERPIASFVTPDALTLKIESKSGDVPVFIGKNAALLSEAYSSVAEMMDYVAAKEDVLMKQVELGKREVEFAKQETQRHKEAAAKLQRYLAKQETGMDAVMLELSFGSLVDASSSSLVAKCKSILDSHLSESMSELRSVCSFSSAALSVSDSSSLAADANVDCENLADVIAWKSLEVGQEVGAGGFGSVFASELTLSDGQKRPVAIKVPVRTTRESLASIQRARRALNDMPTAGKAVRKSMQNEIATYKRIDHPNVVRYLGCTMEPSPASPICIVQQYCASGDLHSLLTAKPMSSEKFAFQTALQIVDGMSAAHTIGVVHRDLKPANVLLCSFPASSSVDMTICKIVDFGSAALKDLNNELSRITGNAGPFTTAVNGFTSRYSSPELLDDDLVEHWQNSYAQDLWAFGLVLFQLRTGTVPFEKSKSEQTMIKKISSGHTAKQKVPIYGLMHKSTVGYYE